MNKTTSRENFIPETRVQFSNDSGCYIKKLRCGILIVLFIGLLIGVIVLAVLYSRKEECTTQQTTSTLSVSDKTITSGELVQTTVKPTIKNEDYRLKEDVIPLKYNLFIQPFINGNASYFEGNVLIDILCKSESDTIALHSQFLNISYIKFYKMANDCLSDIIIVDESINELTEMLTITLDEKLTVNQTYQLNISFTGSMVKTNYRGFYVGDYQDQNGNTKYYAATQFQTTSARRTFPCFDEPGFKAKFIINIKREAKYHSLSNMELENSTQQEDSWTIDRFKESVPMSTYLVAFIVSEFERYPTHLANPSFGVWANPAILNQTEYSYEIGKEIQGFLGEMLETNYPLTKTDMVAIPHFAAGAMENWGLIMYREIAMTYDPVYSPIYYKQYVASVVAHEINHMWFGNLVTPKWWSDSWLNEGFASYFVYPVLANVTKWKNYMDFIATDDCYAAYEVDARNNSTPIKYDVYSSKEVANIFGTIIYSKGACVLNMIKQLFMTELQFMTAIREYLKDAEYNTVDQEYLFRFLVKNQGAHETDEQIIKYLRQWTELAGYPVVEFSSFNYSPDDSLTYVNISQKRFLIDPSQTTKEVIWGIPLTFMTKNQPDLGKIYWFNTTENKMVIKLEEKPSWVIANAKQAGFYRVNYQEENWLLLIETLKTQFDDINVLNRGQIISDAFNLARAGMLSYTIPMKILNYLKTETDFVPWNIAFNEIDKLLKSLLDSPQVDKFMEYIRNIIGAQYLDSHWEISVNDAELDKQLLNEIIVDLACSYNFEECISKAKEVFDKWKKGGETGVAPIMLGTAACTAIKHGTFDDWAFTFAKYLNSTVVGEKMDLLKALACSREPWVLQKFMTLALDPVNVKPLNAYRVFRDVAFNKDSRYLYLNFLQQNWKDLEDGFLDQFNSVVVRSLSSIASGISTEFGKEKIVALKSKASEKYYTYMDSAVEQINVNIRWSEKYEKEIIKFIIENNNSGKPDPKKTTIFKI